MPVDPQLVGTFQGVVGIIGLVFLRVGLQNRDKPGSTGFAMLNAGVALWALMAAAGNFTTDIQIFIGLYTVQMFGVQLTAVGWILLALEVTERDITRRLLAGLAVAIGILQATMWTNPFHEFFLHDTEVKGQLVIFEWGFVFWIHSIFSYALVLLGTGLLLFEASNASGLRRRQMLLLASAVIPATLGNLLTLSEVIPPAFDLTVFGFVISAIFLGAALYSGRFLDIAPVARSTTVSQMRDAMIALDEQNRVVDCNERARELFDVGEEYAGLYAREFFDQIPEETLARFADVTDTEAEVSVTIDGELRHFAVSVSLIEESSREGRVVILHDITEQKRREHELERQNERLDRFASVVSHDLRNPLNAAQGYLDLAYQTGEDEHFQKIENAHERMEMMIAELLTLARTETSVEDAEPVLLRDVVEQAWETATTGQATLELNLPEDWTIEADESLLRNVFENLFRNAADHNEGPLTVRVGTFHNSDEIAGFYVEDDGSGIPEDQRADIFDHGYTTNREGTGFGLSIVQAFVQAHGWEISITESEEGGARFEIRVVETP